ncbi:alpha/beta hydrolase [Kiritimatiellota bacterium B12222]|nr:alpha/beta hydrolase [Kiritimatiellota bacterium B12222]
MLKDIASVPVATLVYKEVDGRKLGLHIFEPPEGLSSPRPCVLLIHSGGWTHGSPQKYFRIAKPLSEMGVVVAVMEYRFIDETIQPSIGVLDAVEDAQDAMRYLYAHTRELNIDPKRLLAVGGSAGAHLAAGLALFDDLSDANDPSAYRPVALVLFNPVIDTSEVGYGNRLLGDQWEKFSPLHQLKPGFPPTLIFHGTGDQVAPYEGSRAFAEKAEANGDICLLITNEGGDHGYYNQSPIFNETMDAIQSFCEEHGFL